MIVLVLKQTVCRHILVVQIKNWFETCVFFNLTNAVGKNGQQVFKRTEKTFRNIFRAPVFGKITAHFYRQFFSDLF